MTDVLHPLPNAPDSLARLVAARRITWRSVVLMLIVRLTLAVLLQACAAAVYAARGNTSAWQTAGAWWTVYGTLIDLGCLALLHRLAARDGIRVSDLLGFDHARLGRDILLGLAFIPLGLIAAVGGGLLATQLLYPGSPPPSPFGALPTWATWYSLLVWPLVWGVVEELTYVGYALPRVEALTRYGWLAVLVVGLAWAFQHVGMPLVFDARFMLWRFVSSLGIGLLVPVFYLRTRRLLPFVLAHWAFNFLAVLTQVVLPRATM